MSIIVERKTLLDTLQKISGPTVGKSNFPIFSTVLIEFLDRKTKFTTTDLELTIIAQLDISSEVKQKICVSLMKLLSILKEFSLEEVNLKPQKNFLLITLNLPMNYPSKLYS